MRPPERISVLLQGLAILWKEWGPDQRFGQLIKNVVGDAGRDIWDIEDDEWQKLITDKFITELKAGHLYGPITNSN